jgi:lactam utilization protein B
MPLNHIKPHGAIYDMPAALKARHERQALLGKLRAALT